MVEITIKNNEGKKSNVSVKKITIVFILSVIIFLSFFLSIKHGSQNLAIMFFVLYLILSGIGIYHLLTIDLK